MQIEIETDDLVGELAALLAEQGSPGGRRACRARAQQILELVGRRVSDRTVAALSARLLPQLSEIRAELDRQR